MKSNSFSIELKLNASAEKVWKAISDKDQMKQWYFDLAAFKPEVGFEFQFAGTGSAGDEYIHVCKVLAVFPGNKLEYSWTYKNLDGYSIVTFELFPEGDTTRLKLTHIRLESFKENGPDFAKESFAKGWTEIIGSSLPKFLSSQYPPKEKL